MRIAKIGISALVAFIAFSVTAILYAEQAYAAEIAAPRITNISMDQAYQVSTSTYGYISKNKIYGKATRKDANWDCNYVYITFSDLNMSDKTVGLERSENPYNGFDEIEFYDGGSPFTLCDADTERGKTYYYRVVVKCYTAQGVVSRTSNTVSIKTSPKTLKTKARFKTPSGWKSSIRKNKKNASLLKRNKKTTFRISWNKRSDVDGYYVYKVGATWDFPLVKLNKSYLYMTTTHGVGGTSNSPGYFYYRAVNSKKFKKVATLKKTATSYTLRIKNRAFLKYSRKGYNYFYAVVPYIKQNGKIYIGDCNKAFFPSGNPSDGIYLVNDKFSTMFPFPLM